MTNATAKPSAAVHADLSPALFYRDADRAIAFLKDGLGFDEVVVYRDDDGVVGHAELSYRSGLVQISSTNGEATPFQLGPCCLYLVTDDPDTMHERAVAAGGEVVQGLTDHDYGSREASVRDTEGYVWCYGTYRPGATKG